MDDAGMGILPADQPTAGTDFTLDRGPPIPYRNRPATAPPSSSGLGSVVLSHVTGVQIP